MAKTAPEVGREVVTAQVRMALNLSSDREADNVVKVVLYAIVATIQSNIDTDGFALKLPGFGKFKVRHTTSKKKALPLLGGKVVMTRPRRKVKFTPLSEFRQLEPIPEQKVAPKKARKS